MTVNYLDCHMTMRRISLLLAAAAACSIAVGSGSVAAADEPEDSVAAVIAPDATWSIDTTTRGNPISVTLADADPTGVTGPAPGLRQSDREWSAILLATLIAQHHPSSTRANITVIERERPPDRMWGLTLRAFPGQSLPSLMPLLGTVSAAQVEAQLAANAAVLEASAGPAAEAKMTYTVLAPGGLPIVLIDVRVNDLLALRNDLVNLKVGAKTGLPAVVRALAVRVHDAAGLSVGGWSNTEIGFGISQSDGALGPVAGTVTWPYRSITGVPGPSGAITSGPMRVVRVRAGLGDRTRDVYPTEGAAPRVIGCLSRRARALRLDLTEPASALSVALHRVSRGRLSRRLAAVPVRRSADRRWTALLPSIRRRAGALAVTATYGDGTRLTYVVGLGAPCRR